MDLQLKCQITFDHCNVNGDTASKHGESAYVNSNSRQTTYRLPETDAGRADARTDKGHLGLPVKYPTTGAGGVSSGYSNDVGSRFDSRVGAAANDACYANPFSLDDPNSHAYLNSYASLPYNHYPSYNKDSQHYYHAFYGPESRTSGVADAYSLVHHPSNDAGVHNISPYYHSNRIGLADGTLYGGYAIVDRAVDCTYRRNFGESGVQQYSYSDGFHQPHFLSNPRDGSGSDFLSLSHANDIAYDDHSCKVRSVLDNGSQLNIETSTTNDVKELQQTAKNFTKMKPRNLKYRTRTDEFPFSYQIRKQEKNMMKKLKELEKSDAEKSKQLMEFYQYQMAYAEKEYKGKTHGTPSAFISVDHSSAWDDLEYQAMQIIQQVEDRIRTIYDEKDCVHSNNLNICCGEIRKTRLLPKRSVKILETWFQENLSNPYPSRDQTVRLALDCGLTVEQVRKWFANKRNRSRNNRMHVMS